MRTSTHPVMTSTGLSASSPGHSPRAKTPGTPQCIFNIVLTSITLAQPRSTQLLLFAFARQRLLAVITK